MKRILSNEDRVLLDELVQAAKQAKAKPMTELERLYYDIHLFDVYGIHDARVDPVVYSKTLMGLRQRVETLTQPNTPQRNLCIAGLSASKEREIFDRYFESQHRMGKYSELRAKVMSNPVTKLIYEGWDEESVVVCMRIASMAKAIQAYTGPNNRMVKGHYVGLPIGDALKVIQTHNLPYGMATNDETSQLVDRFAEYVLQHVANLLARGKIKDPGTDSLTIGLGDTNIHIKAYPHPSTTIPVYHVQVSSSVGGFGVLL